MTTTETSTVESDATPQGEQDVDESARARSDAPFGGLSPQEAGRRSAQARKERAAARTAEAELDRLTVLARAGAVAAHKLDAATQGAILQAMIEKAKDGHVQHARFVLDWLTRLGPSTPDDGDVELADPELMSPAQRAQLRARILRELQDEESPAQDDIP